MKRPFTTAAMLVLSGGFALAQSPAPGTSPGAPTAGPTAPHPPTAPPGGVNPLVPGSAPAGLPSETVGRGGSGTSELQMPEQEDRRHGDQIPRDLLAPGSTPNLPDQRGQQ